MEHIIEVMGLDKDFNIVGLLTYTNLQWRRRFYECGTFSIQIPIEQYDASIKYIYSKDRLEVGEISQINYIESNSGKTFALSGYFLENELNRRIAYQVGTGNITNSPSWVNQTSNAEDVATAFFDAFKDVSYSYNGNSYQSTLGIATGESKSRGNTCSHERGNELLGDKIYTILKPSEMSFRVAYDFVENKKQFECFKGRDLTQTNTENNNPVIFSTYYGNLKNPNIVLSDSDYKNCYIVTHKYSENDKDYSMVQANCERTISDSSDRFIVVSGSVTKSDYKAEKDYISALHAQGHEELIDCKSTMSFDFDIVEGSYNYLEDFDLGDKCSLEVTEIGVSKDAVLVACDEVIKQGQWTLTMEFDV